ncbi:glycerophosphodiester phosphodiesterase family protein [Halomonas vilamensis]|uniref:Glycerophosphodiester phosphodiesterase family protein n=1 Tax=Vreelandella vilamensis TaxID=531309 RepID=A0ABU1H3Z0_9GAMM|nr:glycerophosphodiester phosphodiesterase family protein [Halomonas vilamensis]MDR5898825.1 glycerophosphodiester phosphodiesterase family protein [Halomonas vilamensis]
MMHPEILLPTLIAHRGYSSAAPENTLAAVKAAHDAGTQWVELDVQLLGDGTAVIWHDKDVSRCSDGQGDISRLSWAQVCQLDVGEWFDDAFRGERMASLTSMLALVNTLGMSVNIELKIHKGRDGEALVDQVIPSLMSALAPERLIVSSFNMQALQRCRHHANAQELALGMLFRALPADWQSQCETIDAYSVHCHWPRLKRHHVKAVCDAGYPLLCYTVNDPSAFQPYWAWGVTSAFTDDPATLRRYLNSQQDKASR